MFIPIQRFHALGLTALLLCQVVLAGTGGLQLCLPTSDSLFELKLNCDEPDAELCCGTSPQKTLLQKEFGQSCELCYDLTLGADVGEPWFVGERGSPKLPVCYFIANLDPAPVEPPPVMSPAAACPKRAPPIVSDALRQFREVVSLRI